jgi:hypothetical protein
MISGHSWTFTSTPAVLKIGSPEPENGGSIAYNPINSVDLLGIAHMVGLIC